MESVFTRSVRRSLSKISLAAISAYTVFGSTLLGAIPVAHAAPVTLMASDFGTGSSTNDIADWEEEGSDADSHALAQQFSTPITSEDGASPDGGRFAKIRGSGADWICRQVDATGYDTLTLSYFWKEDTSAADGEVGIVEYFTGGTCDSPAGLTTLASHELDDGNIGDTPVWTSNTINLPGGLNDSSFGVRFRNAADGSNDHFRVDGVSVDGEEIVLVVDTDGDTVPDVSDNCPLIANAGQEDTMDIGDGFGDACSSEQTLVVTPTIAQNWEITDVGGGATHDFVFGPATPPLGDGSLQMTVVNGTDYSIARNTSFSGARLDQITDLSYDTYVSSFTSGQAPVLSLRFDNDNNGTVDSVLYFEPVYQNGTYGGDPVPNQCVGNEGTCAILNTWQHWDAFNGGWWISPAGGPPLTTLQSYLASNPDATIVNEGGVGGVRVFAGAGVAVTGNFDNVSLKVKGDRTTYDFDPDPPVCGNTVVEGGETCDDGNIDNGDGCDMSCQVEPPPTCNGSPATIYVDGGFIVGGPNDGDPYTGSLVGTLFGSDVMVGTADDDSILGLGGADTICGLGGNDYINGGSGNDYIDGGDNIDLCVGGFGSNSVNNCEGSNAFGGMIIIEKDAQPDSEDDFSFSGYYNPLPWLVNNFTLDDDGGSDSTYENVFYDDYIVGQYTATEAVHPDWDLTSIVCDDAGSSTDLGTRTANIDLDLGEIITCTFVNEPVVVLCNGLVPTITGSGVINGTGGDDVILGSDGNDVIDGGEGSDTICALGGEDTIDGKNGSDWIDGGDDNDEVDGGGGAETIFGGEGDDTLDGGNSPDVINGGEGNDVITGANGGDQIDGGEGNNTVTGGNGDDTISTGSGDDNIDGGADTDICLAGSGTNNVVNCEDTGIVCGNGIIELGEQCDDSNTDNGDGCSNICQIEAVACVSVDADLLAYLKLDETSGPNAADDSGNGNSGLWTGTPASATGATGLSFYNPAAIDLDGVSHVDMGDVLDMNASDMTVSLWFNTTDTDYSLFSKSFYGSADSRFFLIDEGTGVYAGFHGTSIVETTPRILGLNDGNWHHAVVVFDRDGMMTLYVDNVNVASADISAQSAHVMQSAYEMYLGRYNDAVDGTNPHPSTLALDGLMDDVRFYGRAFGPSEVGELYAGLCDATSPVVSCNVTDANLVAHWKFDEGSSSSAADSTTHNNAGVLSGGWSSSTPSTLFDNPFVASFDGSDDVVGVSDTTDLNFDSVNPFSGSAWVNPTAFSGYQTVLHKLDDSTSAYRGYLFTLNNGVPEVWLIDDYTGGSYMVVPATGPLSTGDWQHIGFTYDGSGTSGGVRLYVNGADVTGGPSVDAFSGGFSTGTPFEMGLRSFSLVQPFHGLMDDVRIYDIALNGTQIGALAGGQCDAGVLPPVTDTDGDGHDDVDDNCPLDPNADQANNDGDSEGDVCDADDDNDGIVDAIDNCDFDSNPDQEDEEPDGEGNACDPDFVPSFTSFTIPEDDDNNSGGGHRGSRINLLGGAANFLTGNMPGGAFGGIAPGAFGGGSDDPLSDDEMRIICSLRKALPTSTTATMYEWLANHLAPIMNRDVDMLLEALRDSSLCAVEARAAARVAVATPFPVDAAGFPVSSNDTWNACITRTATLEDIRNNTDKDEDGLGRDCSFYRTGSLWKHPDLNVYFTFDRKKMTVKLPAGYVVEKPQAVSKL